MCSLCEVRDATSMYFCVLLGFLIVASHCAMCDRFVVSCYALLSSVLLNGPLRSIIELCVYAHS